MTDLLRHLGALALGARLLLNNMNLSLLFHAMIAQATRAEGLGQQQSAGVIYILRWEPLLRFVRLRRKEVDILRPASLSLGC